MATRQQSSAQLKAKLSKVNDEASAIRKEIRAAEAREARKAKDDQKKADKKLMESVFKGLRAAEFSDEVIAETADVMSFIASAPMDANNASDSRSVLDWARANAAQVKAAAAAESAKAESANQSRAS